MIPLVWIALTGFKSPPDAISYPPKYVIGGDSEAGFQPTLEGYVNLFTTRTRQTQEYLDAPILQKVGQMKLCASTTWS